MSLIDLGKLIVRKKFFIPEKSTVIHELILEQLTQEGTAAFFETKSKRTKSGSFLWNFEKTWAASAIISRDEFLTKKTAEKYIEEFQKDRIKHRDDLLKTWVRNDSVEVRYVVLEEHENGCLCELTCYPVLYKVVVFGLSLECSETEIQDAVLQCEAFLVDIFVGGLNGEEIVEKREDSRWELLINDVTRRQITDRVYQMLEQATGEVLLMGWLGTDCLPKLKELRDKGVTVQAGTHRPAERKSPVDKNTRIGFTEAKKILGDANISINKELHGRAIIVDNKALIGSMDFNSFSLSGEHREFAIYTEDVDAVRTMRRYFRKIFVPLKN